MEANPPTLIGVIAASEPPQIMASASPRAMIRNESPIAWEPEEQAVQVEVFGPFGAKANRNLAGSQIHNR